MFVRDRSAGAGLCDPEERVDGEQLDAALVGAHPAPLHHPAVPAALLREGTETTESTAIYQRDNATVQYTGDATHCDTLDDPLSTLPCTVLYYKTAALHYPTVAFNTLLYSTHPPV